MIEGNHCILFANCEKIYKCFITLMEQERGGGEQYWAEPLKYKIRLDLTKDF